LSYTDGGGATGELTVLELNTAVEGLLEAGFPIPFWVRGVVTGLRRVSGRGHAYFQLAEPSEPGEQPEAVVDCALFAGDRASITVEAGRNGQVFELTDNTEVRILARVNFWPRSGRFQLVMKGFDHGFTGASSAIHLQKLLEKLHREGVLEENGTLSMPVLPLNVGLVTSKGSAAAMDFLKTLSESGYPFRVYASWASMQGSETAASVCAAFMGLLDSPVSAKLDAVVLTRGGGSATDLAWLNDERIARTVAQLPWPVVSAIGHEIDTTLPDHAAHTRAKTPTHAASLLVDAVARFEDRLSLLTRTLTTGLLPMLSMRRMRVDSAAETIARALESLPAAAGKRLDLLSSRLGAAAGNALNRWDRKLTSLERAVEVRDPEKMLKLGWAVVRNPQGLPVRSASGVSAGDELRVSMKDGTLETTVKDVIPWKTSRTTL
jgi:exodeoxyribonuclease VII large subunit